MTTSTSADGVLLHGAVDAFQEWIGDGADHHIRSGDEDYVQPFVYLSFHLISMRLAGWVTDFDELGVVSGASALFAHQPQSFGCKYAHLQVEPDRRIAEATGFGYTWGDFDDAEAAWRLLCGGIDAGRPLKGWDWENVLFAGYRDARLAGERQVYALTDGPQTSARWWSWSDFEQWCTRVLSWRQGRLGQFDGSRTPDPPAEVARRVLCYLVTWSELPPPAVQDTYPAATFGLAGMAAYAANCANVDLFDSWVMCHDVNGWWTLRNATAVWLRRLADTGALGFRAQADLEAAAAGYGAAYAAWGDAYGLLGHGATEEQHRDPERRRQASAHVRRALRHERQAISHLRRVLEEKG